MSEQALHPTAMRRISAIRADFILEADRTYSYQYYILVDGIRVNLSIPISGYSYKDDAVKASKLNHEEAARLKSSDAVISQIKEILG